MSGALMKATMVLLVFYLTVCRHADSSLLHEPACSGLASAQRGSRFRKCEARLQGGAIKGRPRKCLQACMLHAYSTLLLSSKQSWSLRSKFGRIWSSSSTRTRQHALHAALPQAFFRLALRGGRETGLLSDDGVWQEEEEDPQVRRGVPLAECLCISAGK